MNPVWNKKLLAVVLALVLVLSGCSEAPIPQQSTQPVRFYDEIAAPKELVFLVDSAAPPILRQGAELFARKVAEFSDGVLNIQVRSSSQPVQEFQAGAAHFVFVDSRKNSDFCESFPVINLPAYGSYNRITMGLGSKQMLEALGDTLADQHALFLGAYYQGSTQLFVAQEDRPGLVEDGAAREDQEEPILMAAVRADSSLTGALVEYGAQVHSEPSAAARRELLVTGAASLAEFSVDEINAMDWQDQDLRLVMGYYGVTTQWLTVDSRLYSQLSPANQAVLHEASSYLYPVIDAYYTKKDADLLVEMRSQGVEVQMGDSALQKAADAACDRAVAGSSQGRYVLKLLKNIS